MFKIVLAYSGVAASVGAATAADITREFADHRPWHKGVECTWDGAQLILQALNEVDEEGLELMDEFSDCLAAYIAEPIEGDISVVAITRL